jgi:ABC-type antimicrobial peptide transport system permease subunit
VLRQGITLTGWGVVIGLVGAVATSRVIVSLLFTVSPLDPITFGGVVLLLVVTGLVACAVPALRAIQVDPARTLRAE